MNHFERDIAQQEDTEDLAHRIAELVRPADLLVLTGALGAGKTFFAGALMHAMGLDPDEPVTSPTFALVNEYPLEPPVCHADLYRLRTEEDVEELGLDARRSEGWALVVEWGSPFSAVLGGDEVEIRFDLSPRRATIAATTARSSEYVQALKRSS